MPRYEDISGEKFGRWTALSRAGKEFAWNCVCECGVKSKVFTQSLKNGRSSSCGCLQRELAAVLTKERKTTHGAAGIDRAPEYSVWAAMKSRCSNPKVKNYGDYGGRGIKVCPRWERFENFADDMGPRPDGGMLDRKDNDGDYTPDNCVWATRQEQNRNTRRNRFLEHDGKRLCVTEWADLTGIHEAVIRNRLSMGWDVGQVLTQPPRVTKRTRK